MPIATPVTSDSGVYNDHNQYDQDERENDRGDHDGDDYPNDDERYEGYNSDRSYDQSNSMMVMEMAMPKQCSWLQGQISLLRPSLML